VYLYLQCGSVGTIRRRRDVGRRKLPDSHVEELTTHTANLHVEVLYREITALHLQRAIKSKDPRTVMCDFGAIIRWANSRMFFAVVLELL
jgi:hypothetical protein